MKLKKHAVRSLTTHQLKELADIAYIRGLQRAAPQPNREQNYQHRPQQTATPSQNGSALPRQSTDAPAQKALRATPIWDLKDRAEELREREQIRREREGQVARKRGAGVRRKRRGPNLFERIAQMLLPKPKAQEPQKTEAAGHGIAGLAEITKQPFPDSDRNIHLATKQALGETIVGGVGLNDVLKELERRGVSYKPPIDEDGVLNIEESDLVPGRHGEYAKLRRGIDKYLKDHQEQIAGIRVNTTRLVDLGSVNMPHGFVESTGPIRANYFNVKELHTVGDVTVEEFIRAGEIQGKGNINARDILTSECTVYGNINCADTLKFTSGNTDSKQLMTGNVQCGHIASEDDREVEVSGGLSIRGNCRVPRLTAKDLTVGWELQNTKQLYVAGKANITRLSRTIDAEAEFKGDALQQYIDQLRDMRKEQREEEVLSKINAATAQAGKDGAQTIEWTAEEMETNAYKEHVLSEAPKRETPKRQRSSRVAHA